ncbi:unnamed protein product, partial [Rotaria sp. Silwood1]
ILSHLTQLIITNKNDFPIYSSSDTNLGFLFFVTHTDLIYNEILSIIPNDTNYCVDDDY